MIFADDGGVGDALSAHLEAAGDRSILVARGTSYEQTDERHFRIRADQAEDIKRVFDAIEDDYFRERRSDVDFVGDHILGETVVSLPSKKSAIVRPLTASTTVVDWCRPCVRTV